MNWLSKFHDWKAIHRHSDAQSRAELQCILERVIVIVIAFDFPLVYVRAWCVCSRVASRSLASCVAVRSLVASSSILQQHPHLHRQPPQRRGHNDTELSKEGYIDPIVACFHRSAQPKYTSTMAELLNVDGIIERLLEGECPMRNACVVFLLAWNWESYVLHRRRHPQRVLRMHQIVVMINVRGIWPPHLNRSAEACVQQNDLDR